MGVVGSVVYVLFVIWYWVFDMDGMLIVVVYDFVVICCVL